MVLFGTIVNAISIIICSLIGLFFSNIKDKYKETITHGIALAVLLIGIQMALEAQSVIVILLSILIGAIIGELLRLEDIVNRFGTWIAYKFTSKHAGTNVGQAFVTASILFAVGAMAFLGALDSGLRNDHELLLTKSALDGFTSFILTTTLGIGVILSAIPVFLFQGAVALLATQIERIIPAVLFDEILTHITAVGGLLILAIGLNILNVTKIRVTNLLPALFIVGFLIYLKQFI